MIHDHVDNVYKYTRKCQVIEPAQTEYHSAFLVYWTSMSDPLSTPCSIPHLDVIFNMLIWYYWRYNVCRLTPALVQRCTTCRTGTTHWHYHHGPIINGATLYISNMWSTTVERRRSTRDIYAMTSPGAVLVSPTPTLLRDSPVTQAMNTIEETMYLL